MSDSVLFAIDFSTSVETIAAFKAKVKAYVNFVLPYHRNYLLGIRPLILVLNLSFVTQRSQAQNQ